MGTIKGHSTLFQDTKILDNTSNYFVRLHREAIEIHKHKQNFNRKEETLRMNRAWFPVLKNTRLTKHSILDSCWRNVRNYNAKTMAIQPGKPTTTICIIFGNGTKISKFCMWMNSVNPNIQFTWQYNSFCISFLDVTVYRSEQNTLGVQPYGKDTNSYLHYIVPSTLLILGEISPGHFLKLRRNFILQKDYKQGSREMVRHFNNIRYLITVIEQAKKCQ
ncbi:uncharacterized protein LOC129332292 [Eublepharis macularius]|uniref:Uncharacterized protein LOC129332292 n=1 Tax=Eublepharis macularius TaxID=481883 RepID=A0AA97JLG6_EUBMA|nr:uncharacterized protein LOC129332292 [Eublepharis macularius]